MSCVVASRVGELSFSEPSAGGNPDDATGEKPSGGTGVGVGATGGGASLGC